MIDEEAKKLKVGDIVTCNFSFFDYPQKGWKGKVIYTEPRIGIEWEYAFTRGHTGRGHGKDGYCREYCFNSLVCSKTETVKILNKVKMQLEFDF